MAVGARPIRQGSGWGVALQFGWGRGIAYRNNAHVTSRRKNLFTPPPCTTSILALIIAAGVL